jgi:hypothetical protein
MMLIDPGPPGDARELADRFGTPLYVFDGARLAAEAEGFAKAWGGTATVAYSMKCNPLMGVIARLHAAGCWAEVASGFEYRAARRAGVPGGRIVFNGPLKRRDELTRALAEGATIYACRFAMGALYGMREDDLIPGVTAFNPLDVLDSALTAWRNKAFQLNTWTV